MNPLQTTKDIGRKIRDLEPTEKIATYLTKTVGDQDKLFKAQEPRTNLLNKAVDFKKLRKNSDIANQEIIKAGYIPVDTSSRALAHANTMQKVS